MASGILVMMTDGYCGLVEIVVSTCRFQKSGSEREWTSWMLREKSGVPSSVLKMDWASLESVPCDQLLPKKLSHPTAVAAPKAFELSGRFFCLMQVYGL